MPEEKHMEIENPPLQPEHKLIAKHCLFFFFNSFFFQRVLPGPITNIKSILGDIVPNKDTNSLLKPNFCGFFFSGYFKNTKFLYWLKTTLRIGTRKIRSIQISSKEELGKRTCWCHCELSGLMDSTASNTNGGKKRELNSNAHWHGHICIYTYVHMSY